MGEASRIVNTHCGAINSVRSPSGQFANLLGAFRVFRQSDWIVIAVSQIHKNPAQTL